MFGNSFQSSVRFLSLMCTLISWYSKNRWFFFLLKQRHVRAIWPLFRSFMNFAKSIPMNLANKLFEGKLLSTIMLFWTHVEIRLLLSFNRHCENHDTCSRNHYKFYESSFETFTQKIIFINYFMGKTNAFSCRDSDIKIFRDLFQALKTRQ